MNIYLKLLLVLTAFALLADNLTAQDQDGERRSRRRDRSSESGGPPPWMQGGPGGPSGGPPPWMQGGPGGDRPGRGGRSDADRNERSIGMLRAMDTNRDGKLEPSEIPEYRRPFVSMTVTRLGGDPNKTIDIDELARKASTSSTANSSASSARSSGANLSIATDPLVPYFGEKEPATTAVLSFGQREPQPKTAAGNASTAAPLSQSDQILRSAREIMNKYDKNKNGTLDKDKGEWVSSLPFNADSADKNRDGRISMSELIAALGGKAGVTTGAAAVQTKQSAAYERLPQGVPDWFFERDKDQDGQLTMMEYAGDRPWTEAMADEFRFLDKNNDGVATVAEVFETLKQVDQEKRLKEEQAKREVERRKGVGAAVGSSATPAPPTATAPAGQPPQPPPTGTPSGDAPPPESTAKPGETPPNWQPTSQPTGIPASAPYSSGTSDNDRRSGNTRQYTPRTGRSRR